MYHDPYFSNSSFMKKRDQMSSQSISGLGLSRREMRKNYKFLVKSLLTEAEKEFMYRCAKKYQRLPYIEIFCQELSQIINTPNKLRLLPYIRTIISEFDKYDYDKFVNRLKYRMMEGRTDFTVRSPDVYSLTPSVRSSVPKGRSDIRVIIIPHQEENLGFSIRGGSENGLGIFVSEVDPGSSAAESGLEVGDQILEANNISLESAACSSAVRVLTVNDRLKLIIKRVGKIPEWKLAKEKVLWYDVHSGDIIAAPPSDTDPYHISGLDQQGLREKRVALTTSGSIDFIGFNIRGGNEYGLGIFVSRVDPGGLAEKNGVCAGDQILDVNGRDFTKISHSAAADFLRTNERLIITLREVGRYPAFKELFAEYTWSEKTNIQHASGTVGRRAFEESPVLSGHSTFRNHKAKSLNNLYMGPGQGRPLQSDIYLPDENDVVYHNIEREPQPLTVYKFTEKPEDEIEVEIRDDVDASGDEYVSLSRSAVVNATDSRKLKQHERTSVYPSTSKSVQGNQHYDSDHFMSSRDVLVDSQIKSDRYEQNHSSPNVVHSVTSNVIESPAPNNYANVNGYRREEVTLVKSESKSPINLEEYIIPKHKLPPLMAGQKEIVNTSRSSNVYHQQNGVDYPDGDDTVIITEVDMQESEPVYSQVIKIKKKDVQTTKASPSKSQGHQRVTTDSSLTREEEEVMNHLDDQILMLENRKIELSSREIAQINKDKDSAEKKGTWSKIKTRLKDSIRLKKKKGPPDSPNPELRSHPPALQTQASLDMSKMTVLEERSKQILPQHEHQEVMALVNSYHQSKDLDHLVEKLLQILNTPERMLLLKDVRGVVYPYHIPRFDNMVNYYEIEKYEDMSTKLHLPLRHNETKPKKQLMTTVLDENGHFHIRTVNQHEKDVKTTTKVLQTLRSNSIETPPEPAKHVTPTTNQIQWVKLNHVEDHSKRNSIRQIFNNIDDIPDPRSTVVFVPKQKAILGLLLRGGRVGQVTLPIRIDEILVDSAAADVDQLKPGVMLVSVDGQRVVRCTCTEAEEILLNAYADQKTDTLKLEVKQDKELQV